MVLHVYAHDAAVEERRVVLPLAAQVEDEEPVAVPRREEALSAGGYALWIDRNRLCMYHRIIDRYHR